MRVRGKSLSRFIEWLWKAAYFTLDVILIVRLIPGRTWPKSPRCLQGYYLSQKQKIWQICLRWNGRRRPGCLSVARDIKFMDFGTKLVSLEFLIKAFLFWTLVIALLMMPMIFWQSVGQIKGKKKRRRTFKNGVTALEIPAYPIQIIDINPLLKLQVFQYFISDYRNLPLGCVPRKLAHACAGIFGSSRDQRTSQDLSGRLTR